MFHVVCLWWQRIENRISVCFVEDFHSSEEEGIGIRTIVYVWQSHKRGSAKNRIHTDVTIRLVNVVVSQHRILECSNKQMMRKRINTKRRMKMKKRKDTCSWPAVSIMFTKHEISSITSCLR